jgi:hypothetical protein
MSMPWGIPIFPMYNIKDMRKNDEEKKKPTSEQRINFFFLLFFFKDMPSQEKLVLVLQVK